MGDTYTDPEDVENNRRQELLWPARQHPDELIIPDVYPTKFPGRWVAVFRGSIPSDQRNGLRVEGYRLSRIRLLKDGKAQVIIREDDRPDRGDNVCHQPTRARHRNYRHPLKKDYEIITEYTNEESSSSY